jgi:nucleoside-diphosphate-sugar epimerase
VERDQYRAAGAPGSPTQLPSMRVLLTGHHGYIGSVAAPILAEAGHEVTGLDTFFYEGCDLGEDSTDLPALRQDVRDVTVAMLQGYDAVVHLAALSNDPLGELDSELTREINLSGTVELARKAKEAGVLRFVFASSCSMYGSAGTDELVTEEAPLRPLTAYAESKVRAEEALAELADGDFAPVFMRNATAYGASPRVRFDVVLNNLAAWAYTTGKVMIMSDGSPWRPLVHVRDIARAASGALTAPHDLVVNEAFNVGADSENYRVRDLAEIVRNTFPDCEIEYAEGAGPDPRSYRVDFGKFARTLPEAAPTWTARDGARELLDAFESVGLEKSDFDRYTRLARLKELRADGSLDHDLRWTRMRAHVADSSP